MPTEIEQIADGCVSTQEPLCGSSDSLGLEIHINLSLLNTRSH